MYTTTILIILEKFHEYVDNASKLITISGCKSDEVVLSNSNLKVCLIVLSIRSISELV